MPRWSHGEAEIVNLTLNTALNGFSDREFFIANLLVPIHSIIEMIWWTGLAP